MSLFQRFACFLGAFVSTVAFAGSATAAQPVDWGTGFQEAVTPIMGQIHDFWGLLFGIITVITLVVLALLVYVMVRFNHKNNPTPSKTSHNTLLEVVWTAVPILILVVIAIPSLKLLYVADRHPDAEMTIKAIGKQWYWSYEYPDHGDFTFDATMVADADLKEGEPRLLTTDTAVVVPVNTKVRLLVTAGDVIHSFAMPAFGVKLDGVPGRINETWFEATKTGTYYGQCSEICGTGHSYMPIMVKVVEKDAFAKWVEQAKEEYAAVEPLNQPVELAQVQ